LNLRAIISQRLIPGKSGNLIPVMEVMLNQGLIKEHILKGRINDLKDVMLQNLSIGMCTFDHSLLKLFQEGLITEEKSFNAMDISKISLAD